MMDLIANKLLNPHPTSNITKLSLLPYDDLNKHQETHLQQCGCTEKTLNYSLSLVNYS